MRKILTGLLLAGLAGHTMAQNVGVGTKHPDPSASLEVSSPNQGVLFPRMSTDAMKAIKNPAKGLMVFDSVANTLMVNTGTPSAANWQSAAVVKPNVASGSTGTWNLQGNAGTIDVNNNPAGNFLGTTDINPLVFKVNNLPFGELMPQNNIYLGAYSGYDPGPGSTNGLDNVGIGGQNMIKNVGFGNVALGAFAAQQMTYGTYNTALGYYANQGNISGNYNTAVGGWSLINTNAAYYNTAVGYAAGMNYNNGYNNVFLGANTDVNGAGYYNVIAIGQQVIATAVSQARIGNTATRSIGGYANWTNFSDGRFKKNMKENVKGIEFIMKLRPITYNLDVDGINTSLGKPKEKDENMIKANAERSKEIFCGFSAQEVEKACQEIGFDFSGVDKPKNDKDFYGIRYSDFVVPLVKGMQEQQQMIEDLRKEIVELKKQINH